MEISKKKPNRKVLKRKWHDSTCESLHKDINKTAALLKKYPKNSFLRGRIQSESKKYKKLVKSKYKAYINAMFKEMDILHGVNPRGYMNIVKSLRDGSFDRKTTDDAAFIGPEEWSDHFSSLLGPPASACNTLTDQELIDFIHKYEPLLRVKNSWMGSQAWQTTKPQVLTEYQMSYLKQQNWSLLTLL